MFDKDLATTQKTNPDRQHERREKVRFPIRREARYKLLKGDTIVQAGTGETVDICSGGVGFAVERELPVGAFIELSISWPVLLDQNCLMRLNVFGRVIRNQPGKSACTIDKYEFRTQSRGSIQMPAVRQDSKLQRWADAVVRRDVVVPIKSRMATA